MNKNNPLVIKQLHLVPEYLEICALWNYQQWGEEIGFSQEASLDRVRQVTFSLQGEASVIAFWDKVPVGMSFIEKTCAEEHPELTPWLTGVYVEPDYRGKGIAGAMIEIIEDLAYDTGYSKVYLHTPNAKDLYAKWGWQVMDNFERPETGTHAVMYKALV